MQDPFHAPANEQLYREAQLGVAALAVLTAIFAYLAVGRIARHGEALPDHVKRASVARMVHPDGSADGNDPVRPNPDTYGASLAANPNTNRLMPTSTAIPDPAGAASTAVALRENSGQTVTDSQLKRASAQVETRPLIHIPDLHLPRIDHFPGTTTRAPGGSSGDKTDGHLGGDQVAEASLPADSAEPEGDLDAAPSTDIDDALVNVDLTESAPTELPSDATSDSNVPSPQYLPLPDFSDVDPEREVTFGGASDDKSSGVVGPFEITKGATASVQEPAMTSPRPKQDLARPGPDESFDVSVAVQPEPAGRRVQPGPAGFPAAEAEYRKHHVRAGESFYSLAQTYYGDGQYFQALYAFNRDRVPTFDSLPAGTEILIPDIDDLPGARSTRSQPYPIGRDHDRIHVTRANQTLFEVARERLGQASRYIDLLELNRQRLPEGVHALTRLNPGVSLVLPAE